MLTLKYIQENKSEVIERLAKKRFDATQIVAKIGELDDKRKSLQAQADAKQAEANSIAKQVGALMQAGKKDEAEALKKQTASLKKRQKI
jgi:seryl-tRNA synthetase